jgi:hypothetical protein
VGVGFLVICRCSIKVTHESKRIAGAFKKISVSSLAVRSFAGAAGLKFDHTRSGEES